MKYVKNKKHPVNNCTVRDFGSFVQLKSQSPLKLCFVVKIPVTYLGKALLTVIFEVFRVDIDVVFVDTVRLRELGGVLDKLLHLHSRLVFAQFFKGLHWHIGGCHTV